MPRSTPISPRSRPTAAVRYVTEGVLRALHRKESAGAAHESLDLALSQLHAPGCRARCRSMRPACLRFALLPTSWRFQAAAASAGDRRRRRRPLRSDAARPAAASVDPPRRRSRLGAGAALARNAGVTAARGGALARGHRHEPVRASATDVGGTFTDLVFTETDPGADPQTIASPRSTPRRRISKRHSRCARQGADRHFGSRFLRPRHDRRDQCANRAQGRQDRPGDHARDSVTSWRSAAATGRGSSTCTTGSRKLRAARPAPRGRRPASTWRGEEVEPVDLGDLPADRGGFPRGRRQGGRDLPAAHLRQSGARAGGDGGDPAALAGGVAGRIAPDHARVARIRAQQHDAALGLCAADRRALPRPARGKPRGARLSRPALRHAVELRRRFGCRREGDADHHGRVRAGIRRVGSGRTRPSHRRAQCPRPRYRRHHREVLADRERTA